MVRFTQKNRGFVLRRNNFRMQLTKDDLKVQFAEQGKFISLRLHIDLHIDFVYRVILFYFLGGKSYENKKNT